MIARNISKDYNISILDSLEELNEDYDIDPIEVINVSNNDNRYNKYIINLEEVSNYAIKNEIDLSYVINEICNTYKIRDYNIGFSCNPSSLLLDENVIDNADILIENQFPIYLISNIYTKEYREINDLTEAALKDPEILNELSDRNSEAIKLGAKGLGTLAIDHLFGKVLDKKEQVPYDLSGKKLSPSEVKLKNPNEIKYKTERTRNAFIDDYVDDPLKKNVANNAANAGRTIAAFGISNALVNAAEKFAKSPNGAVAKGKRILNAIQTKSSQLMNRMRNANPNNRSIFQRVLDFLKGLRDKVMAAIHKITSNMTNIFNRKEQG